ncbi:MAG: dihydrolipoyl dehydrogenase [Nanoarchaeota archaeon]
MQTFDLIVIGAGSGLKVSSAAADKGMKVAVVEKGPMGGTCLNRGCIPSKIIIHSAEIAEQVKKSSQYGVHSRLLSVDFAKIISRASNIVDKDSKNIEHGIIEDKNTTLFRAEAKFIGERTIQAGKNTIKGNKVVIAAGTRPMVPNIEGLKGSGFMTSDEALRLKKQPKVMTILGGGYIAAELAHFYGSLGTKINIIQRAPLMVPAEDTEIAAQYTKSFGEKYNVLLEHNAVKVEKKNGKFIVTAQGKKSSKKIISDALLVAAGRVSNTDILDLKKTNVEIDEKGYIKTNQYLETTAKNTWALGDIIGRYLFKHTANLEAQTVYSNAILGKKMKMNYDAMPHAIFSSPQIAGVGMTEQALKSSKIKYAAGKHFYRSTGMGIAIQDNEGFVKIFADKKTRKILGCHIIGTDASTLIHEVLVAMKNNLTVDALTNTVHIHPALNEVVQRAALNIEW